MEDCPLRPHPSNACRSRSYDVRVLSGCESVADDDAHDGSWSVACGRSAVGSGADQRAPLALPARPGCGVRRYRPRGQPWPSGPRNTVDRRERPHGGSDPHRMRCNGAPGRAFLAAPSNKRMQLTKRGDLVGVQDGLFFIESRFAADPRCSPALDRELCTSTPPRGIIVVSRRRYLHGPVHGITSTCHSTAPDSASLDCTPSVGGSAGDVERGVDASRL
jgi:hypothetical protein